MKSINSRECYYCGSQNFYYPINNDGHDYYVLRCYKCNKINLLEGWEAVYTSEEDAAINGLFTFGYPNVAQVPVPNIKINTTELLVKKDEVSEDMWSKTMDLMWINGKLHQKLTYLKEVKWIEVPHA